MRYTGSLLTFGFLLVLACRASVGAEEVPQPATVTQADLLRRLIDLDRLTRPPRGERTGLCSSYDRRSRLDARGRPVDMYADNDRGQFQATTPDGWSVLADVPGPGALTRIWTDQPEGRLRFVLDGDRVLELDFANLFNGKTAPFDDPLCYVTAGGGHVCYFPIGFNAAGRVMARGFSGAYQINYVVFPAGTRVQTFSRELDEAARQALDEVLGAFYVGLSDRQLFGDARTYTVSAFEELSGPDTIAIESFPGGGTIRVLHVSFANNVLPKVPYLLHKCLLRVFIDGESEPSVEAPLIDFFGSGFDVAWYNSLLCGTDKWTNMPGKGTPINPNRVTSESRFMYCYFPMPFRDTARVEIVGAPELSPRQKLGVTLFMRVDRTPPPEDALRFKARFRKEDPCRELDYLVLETNGPGRIVGCTLNVDCPRMAWWADGDHKVWIDGEAFPSYFGTGTADFLNEGDALLEMPKALHGVTRTAAFGKQSGYRWLVSDCINFERSVRFVIENLQAGDVRDTYYGSVVYWYGPPGPEPTFPRLAAENLTPPGLRIPGAIEIEDHIQGEGWGTLLKQQFADGGELSGGLAAAITTDQPVRINLPSPRDQTALLHLRIHQLGRFYFDTVEVRDPEGNLVGTVKYDRDIGRLSIYTVGLVKLHAGDNLFTVKCSRKTALDCWILTPAPTTTQP